MVIVLLKIVVFFNRVGEGLCVVDVERGIVFGMFFFNAFCCFVLFVLDLRREGSFFLVNL